MELSCQLENERKYALMLDHYLFSCKGFYFCHSKNASQKIGTHHVFHDLHYAQVNDTYGTIFFKASHVAL